MSSQFLQENAAKQSQLPQLLLIRVLLQTLHQLRCPSLDTLQHLNVSLVVGGPKLNTAFEVRPHQCRVQGHDHFPTPAGHAIFDTSQDATGLLGHLGTLLAHIQAVVNQHPQVLFCQAAFQPLFPKPVALHGVAVAQVQDPALGLVKPHTIDLSPSIQPVQIPLQSLPTLNHINTPAQLGVLCKLTEGALDPLIQIIDKDVKQNWPQHRALGNTACDRPPTGVNSIHHHSLGPAIQPVLYPAKSTPVQAMSSQFLQENAVGNRVKPCTTANDEDLEFMHICDITFYPAVGGSTEEQPGCPEHLSHTKRKTDNFQAALDLRALTQLRLNGPSSLSRSSSDFCSRPFTSFVALLWTRSSTSIEGPKLNTGFEVRPHQCRVQGHDHFPTPAGHTISGTSQDAIGFLGHLGTLLAHIQLAVHQHPQVLLCWAAFQPLFPKLVALHVVVVTQVQDPTLSLVEPHTIGLSPSIQPVQIPLQSLPTLKQINTPAQLSVLCKLTEGALNPLVQIIDKDIKQDWPKY
ncbi:hypothetical protein QYF61_024065 [Mycteria americana]|uniref:Uncharacterized protein n=1 Tax=Mycteria americana TaxID=33587 RepID=A0AAN7S9X8_MYCAM|nr:hypothetical protein QYF61_024065 [Mycteria americana]